MKNKVLAFFLTAITVSFYSCDQTDSNIANSYDEIQKNFQLWFQKGDYQKCIFFVDSLISVYPKDPELYFWKGRCLEKIGENSEAIKEYTLAIEIDSSIAKYFNNRGLVYLLEHKYVEAEKDLTTALNLRTDLSIIFNNLGLVYSHLNEDSLAIDMFSRAIQVDKDPMYFFNRAVALYNEDFYIASINDFNFVLESDTLISEALLYRGLAYYETGDSKQACNDFSRAFTLGNLEAEKFLNSCVGQ